MLPPDMPPALAARQTHSNNKPVAQTKKKTHHRIAASQCGKRAKYNAWMQRSPKNPVPTGREKKKHHLSFARRNPIRTTRTAQGVKRAFQLLLSHHDGARPRRTQITHLNRFF